MMDYGFTPEYDDARIPPRGDTTGPIPLDRKGKVKKTGKSDKSKYAKNYKTSKFYTKKARKELQ